MPSTRTAVRTVAGLPASVLYLLDPDVELDGDLILELERAEESRVRGDAEVRLPHRGAATEMAGARAGDLQPERPRRAAQCQRALDRAGCGAGGRGRRDDTGRGVARLRRLAEDLPRGAQDVRAVPVGERLGPAGAQAHRERAEVEFGGQRRRREAAARRVGHGDPRGPPGDLDRQVVAGPRGEALAPGPQEHLAVGWAQF